MKTLNCSKCQAEVKIKKIPEYHFDTVGLPNVWLINIEGYDCEKCGNQSVMLPNFGHLMTTVARGVVFKNGSFNSQEMCFLKKFFGLSGKEIAQRLGTSEKTVSFWMTGKNRVSPAYGIKLRQLFSEEFSKHLKEKEVKIKSIIEEARKFKKEVRNALSETELIRRFKEKAQTAAKAKIKDAEIFATNNHADTTLQIPYSHVGVELRN